MLRVLVAMASRAWTLADDMMGGTVGRYQPSRVDDVLAKKLSTVNRIADDIQQAQSGTPAQQAAATANLEKDLVDVYNVVKDAKDKLHPTDRDRDAALAGATPEQKRLLATADAAISGALAQLKKDPNSAQGKADLALGLNALKQLTDSLKTSIQGEKQLFHISMEPLAEVKKTPEFSDFQKAVTASKRPVEYTFGNKTYDAKDPKQLDQLVQDLAAKGWTTGDIRQMLTAETTFISDGDDAPKYQQQIPDMPDPDAYEHHGNKVDNIAFIRDVAAD